MSKKQAITLFLLLATLASYSQNRRTRDSANRVPRERVLTGLAGTVTDAVNGQPLPGASITFTDARIGAMAGKEGVYAIRNIPPGHHLVEVSHMGYTTIVEHVDLDSNLQKNFTLYPA